MRPKRSTTTTGGSRGGCDDGVGDNDGNPCQPDGEMDESIVLDTKTLLEMLGPSNPAAAKEEDGEEDGEDEDEKLDLVMDLKRKFSTCVLMMSGGGMLHDDTGGSSGANGGDGSAQTRDSSSSSSSSSGGGVVVSLPGVVAAPAPRHIKTVLRVRPLEPSAGPLSLKVVDGKTVLTINPNARTGASSRVFKYGKVMDDTAPQESVFYETAKPLVEGLLEGPGKNGLVMAYGATNAGKTHTIMGARGEDDGILPRTLAAVYEGMMQGNTGGDSSSGGGGGGRRDSSLRLNFRVVEVYMNKAYDLLRDEQERGAPLAFKQFQGEDKVEGLSDHYPEDLDAALDLVKQARSRAPVSATALNAFSSRGHTVWMIEVQHGDGRVAAAATDSSAAIGGRGSGVGATHRAATRNPMLWIVDLAGSERTVRSMSNSREAANINSDITDVFRCFKQVEAGCQNVAYRTRTLTRMLKNVLVRGADSADPRMSCVMVVNVNPAASEYGETQKVLTNALISMKARIVEEPPRAGCGSEPVRYGLNGHFIGKRQKVGGGGGDGGGPAEGGPAGGVALRVGSFCGKGKENQLALVDKSGRRGAGSTQRAALSRDEQALVIEEQSENVARLQDEVTRLQEEMEEMQEEVWHQAQAELFPQIDGLEKALAESQARESDLRLNLDKLDPVGENARAAVAQSARKQAARKVETVKTQLSQNIREAEDETFREAEKRASAEEALAVALAERDAAAARAAEVLDLQTANEAAVRQELVRSEAKVERLEAVVVAERSRAAELVAKNDGLGSELRAAREQISRLQDAVALAEADLGTTQMDVAASSASVSLCMGDDRLNRIQSGRASDPVFASAMKRGRAPTLRKKAKLTASDSDSASTSEDLRPKRRGLNSSPLNLRARKALGSLRPVDGNAGGTTAAAAQRKGRKRAAGAHEEEGEGVESDAAAISQEETRRCKAAREASMLSKPSPEVVLLTEKQAATRDKANKLVQTRRSNRRKG